MADSGRSKKNLVLILFIVSVVLSAGMTVASTMIISFSIRTMEYNIERRLRAVSKLASQLVTAEELDQYQRVEDMSLPSYQALRGKLRDFSIEYDLLYAYYIRPAEEGRLQYIIDNDFDEKTRVGLDTPPYDIQPVPWIKTALEGQPSYSGLGNYTPGWKGLMTTYTPVFDKTGAVAAIAGVDIWDTPIVHAQRMLYILAILRSITTAVVFASGFISLVFLYAEAENARAASVAKSRFLSRVSHELCTPLNAIIGMSELALRAGNLSQTAEFAGGIRQAGQNLLSLVHETLDYSKIEAGQMRINAAPYSLVSLLNEASNFARSCIGGKPIVFTLDADSGLPAVLLGDETRLRQIMFNLLSNAAKYTNYGFITFKISGKKEDDQDNGSLILVMEISDSGIGIEKRDMENIFDGFFRGGLKRNESIEGIGLGLTITKELCRFMGGNIYVKSEYGKGSVFTAAVHQGFIEGGTITSNGTTAAGQNRDDGSPHFTAPSARLLVVDDLATNLKVAKGLLSPYQTQIDVCLSGEEAVELVKKNQYDIVFMDHMMPGMDGIEAAQLIRAWEQEQKAQKKKSAPLPPDDQAPQRLPVIALTANVVYGMRELFMEHGFSDFLPKPIDITRLDALMTAWLPAGKKNYSRRSPESADAAAPPSGETAEALFAGIEVDGVDLAAGTARYGGSYPDILRSYCLDTAALLEKLKLLPQGDFSAYDIKDYAVTVQGLKGSSCGIFANGMGKLAEFMERTAKAGDAPTIKAQNKRFIETAEALLAALEDLLKKIG